MVPETWEWRLKYWSIVTFVGLLLAAAYCSFLAGLAYITINAVGK